MVRFEREERLALRSLSGRPPFRQVREVVRRVQNDGCVDIDTNHYSVPWRLIGAQVQVVVSAVDHAHLRGIIVDDSSAPGCMTPPMAPGAELLRALSEYEQVAGGGW
jgi:hypothetical protein